MAPGAGPGAKYGEKIAMSAQPPGEQPDPWDTGPDESATGLGPEDQVQPAEQPDPGDKVQPADQPGAEDQTQPADQPDPWDK
jgi:hypothetical protein